MNHPQKGVFTPGRNEPLTGRNANIQPTMFRRKEIFQKAPSERSEPPFSGYSFTGSSVTDNSSLARSNVSQISQQNFARLFKQHMQKNGMNIMNQTSQENLKYKNDLNIMRIEIRGIKQSYHEFNKSFKKKLEEQNETINELRKQISNQNKDSSIIRDDLSTQIVDKIQAVEQEIAVRMRLIFTKMQEDLRKEFTTYANREFIPMSFLDDLDKQLNEFDDRIANMENEYESSKEKGNKENMTASKIDRDSSMIMSSGSELKLKQFERDLTNLKKELDEKTLTIKEIDTSLLLKHQSYSKELKELKETVTDLSTGIKDRQKQYDSFKTNLEVKMENDRKKLFEKLETDFEALAKKIDQDLVLKSLVLSSSIEPEKFKKKTESTSIIVQYPADGENHSKFQENTMDESKMSGMSSFTHLNNQIVKNIETDQNTYPNQQNEKQLSPIGNQALNSKDSPKKTKKITITYGGSEKTIVQSAQGEPQVGSIVPESLPNAKTTQFMPTEKEQQEIKTIYKVDKDGYLMDINNKYLLSPSNSMIFVSEKQIEAMESTNLIKVEKWTGP